MAAVVEAGLWGLAAGSALLLGAALGYGLRVPQKVIATVMAFGAGVLISAVSFELVEEAYEQAGLAPAAVGTLIGAVAYTGGNVWLARRGARHRQITWPRVVQMHPAELAFPHPLQTVQHPGTATVDLSAVHQLRLAG